MSRALHGRWPYRRSHCRHDLHWLVRIRSGTSACSTGRAHSMAGLPANRRRPQRLGLPIIPRFSTSSLPSPCAPCGGVLIRHRIDPAPAVRADIALDHLAGMRRDEQRAGGAHGDALRAVLILSLLLRHLVVFGRRKAA